MIGTYVTNCLNDLKNVDVNSSLMIKLAAGAGVSLTIGYLIKIWHSYGYFARRGISTPKYSFITGNQNELFTNGYATTLQKWTQELGKTYGYYEGHLPVMVTSDLELIEEIFYKQFSNFTARRRPPIQVNDYIPTPNLVLSSKNRWKRMRTIINPTFSPAKLKQLVPHMSKCSDRLVQVIEKHLDEEIKISDFYDRMSMDVVWNGAYGIDMDFQNHSDNEFLRRTIENFNIGLTDNALIRLLIYFYELRLIPFIITSSYTFLVSKLSNRFGNPFFWITQQIHRVLDERLKTKEAKKDYLQILIDSQSETVKTNIDTENYDSSTAKLIEKKMTYNELLMNLIVFLLAGFETTSTTLSFCTYYLAKYPEEMAKIQAEIDSSGIEQFDYDTVNKLEYLDMFIKEIQRMQPIGVFITSRRCTNPTKIKNYQFEENQLVVVDVFSLHYDPKYWGDVDPKVFYPLRFKNPNDINKLVYMPFGAGPRICIGMKFALLEIKLTLVKLLKSYDIVAPPNGLQELVVRDIFLRKPMNGVKVMVKKRNK